MNRPVTTRVVAIAAVAAALLLSGCGRKGPLDLPPSASASPQAANPQSDEQPSFGQPLTDSKAVSAPTGRKRRLPIDVLVD